VITAEQRSQIEGRERHKIRVLSGDVYARQPDGTVVAFDPDGNARRSEWPTRGITLDQAEASDAAIRAVLPR
jgi:hypothetical protein